MARKRATLTDLLNNLTFSTLFDKYKLIAMNEWLWVVSENVVDFKPKHIELPLFDYGMACFFKNPGGSYMILPCTPDGKKNVQGDDLGYNVTGFGFTHHVTADECVIIENNLLRLPTRSFVMHYVNKLAEAERTMDVNVKACKTPVVFACDDNDVLTWKRIFQEVDGNTPAIFADKGLNLDSIQAFLTGVKFLGNELMDYKGSVEGDLLTFLGQNNNPVDKKERLITDEAESNNQLIASFADLQREARERACEEIQAKFPDVEISVKPRVQNPVETVEKPEGKEDV